MFEISSWLLVKTKSSILFFPALVSLVPSATFCSKFKSEATLINYWSEFFSCLVFANASPIPCVQVAFGKLKSPASMMSGTGALY